MHTSYGSTPTTDYSSTTTTIVVTPPTSHPLTGGDVVGISITAVAAIFFGLALYRIFGRRKAS